MKNVKILLFLATSVMSLPLRANEPDSAYIFAYATTINAGHNGLHVAWSTDNVDWHAIGPEYSLLKCDYGRWGSEKRMVSPYLYHEPDGLWHCLWSLNEKDGAFAHTTSKDLLYWKCQTYPIVSKGNCLMPEILKSGNDYTVSWLTDNQALFTTTRDFKTYFSSKEMLLSKRIDNRKTLDIDGAQQTGTVHKVAWKQIDAIIKAHQVSVYRSQLFSESLSDDSQRYSNLKPLKATIDVNASQSRKISDMLVGIFFEDISYAADGGLYAELVQNRGFEYNPGDKEGGDPGWNSMKSWSLDGKPATIAIDSILPIHPNNRHYAVLNVKEVGASLVNEGFDGIALKAGEKYDFSVFVRGVSGNKCRLKVRLTGKNGEVYGESKTGSVTGIWKKLETVILSNRTVADARIEILPQNSGMVHLDMISLFPQKTFKGRKNGLRADLAQTIADIKPKFVRFPGGCVAHGDGLDNMYRWNNTVGSVEARKPQRNIWGYHQTAGLGYYEYFQFCEDIGAQPLPVLPAAVPCQNSATGGAGQQGGLPLRDMVEYVQEVLDLIEWANGDAGTKWGRIRAEAGHPKPFNLKYVGIGNEDLISDVFEERFKNIYKAVREKHPEITVVGTVGPFNEGTDYTEGWRIATELGVPIVDEHYYQSPGWFLNNQDFYDRYDRGKSKVYLGEYATHIPGRVNNIETALVEALYLTTLERNGDVVSMSSYAPLLAKENHTNWNPDLIYFNNTEVKPTVGYQVQKLYGNNAGDEYFGSKIKLSANKDITKRFAFSAVRDSKSKDIIVKLVNILPVETQATVNLKGLPITEGEAVMTVLKGDPTDKLAKPETSTIKVSETFPVSLPAYSFTVIRIKGV